jgi:hypothetical protein
MQFLVARMTSARRDRARRIGLVGSALLAAGLLAMPAAQAATFGALHANEDGQELARSSGGSIYYEGAGFGRTVTERIRFLDTRADGDGAYGVARQQAWDKVTAPRCCTYYTWAWGNEDQTNRYGSDYGWRISYLRESDSHIARWRVSARVCVDQSWEPDACGTAGYREP